MNTVALNWRDSCRLVPSRFPPVSLFEQVTDPADLEFVFAIEALGNPRLREAVGDLRLVPLEQRVSGPGTSAIMAAFTHLNPEGSRFSDGHYGVYYAAHKLETAVAEVSYHRAGFLARTNEPAIEIDMRCYRVKIKAKVAELRGVNDAHLYSPDSYAASQVFARKVGAAGLAGIVFDSVRFPGGECAALFMPKALVPPAREAEHVTLRWNGERIEGWYLKSELREL